MLSRLVHLLIDPLFIFTILVSLALIFYLLKNRSISKRFLVAGFAWFLIISTPWIPNLLIYSLESQYMPLRRADVGNLQEPVDIIVLGGGHSNDQRLPANSRLSQQAVMRLTEGIRIHQMVPGSTLILSGYSSSGTRSHAENLALVGESLGMHRDHMVLHEEPSDTWEEAAAYSERAEDRRRENQATGTVVVVTSAVHMPRAMTMFANHLTTDIAASPTDYRFKMDKQNSFHFWNPVPDLNNISKFKYAVKEYAGLAEYYLFLNNGIEIQ